MKHFVFSLAVCATAGLSGLAPGARAQEPAKQEKADPAKELAAIQKDWRAAQQDFSKAYQEAKTAEERQQVLKEKRPNPAEFADRFFKLAEAFPDSSEAGQALVWIVGNARGSTAAKKAVDRLNEKLAATTDLDELHKTLTGLPAQSLGDLAPQVAERAKKSLDHPKALPLLVWVCSATLYGPTKELAKLYNDTVDLLMDRFAERQEMAPLPGWLARGDDPAWAEKHLRRLMEKNPSAEVKTSARFSLASVLKDKDEASQSEAEKLFQSYIDEFGQVPNKKQQVERAKNELAEMKVRGIGKPAPEIAGDDLDGKAFKLADYKGKVVLLDFWGFW